MGIKKLTPKEREFIQNIYVNSIDTAWDCYFDNKKEENLAVKLFPNCIVRKKERNMFDYRRLNGAEYPEIYTKILKVKLNEYIKLYEDLYCKINDLYHGL